MPRRAVLRALSALVLVGALGACGVGGGEPPLEPFVVVTPHELVLDLPDTGSGTDTGTITARNLSVFPAGPLSSHFTLELDPPDQPPTFTGPDPIHTCGGETLTLDESCTFTLTVEGTAPSIPPAELSWRLLDEDGTTLAYVPIRIV